MKNQPFYDEVNADEMLFIFEASKLNEESSVATLLALLVKAETSKERLEITQTLEKVATVYRQRLGLGIPRNMKPDFDPDKWLSLVTTSDIIQELVEVWKIKVRGAISYNPSPDRTIYLKYDYSPLMAEFCDNVDSLGHLVRKDCFREAVLR